MSSGVDRLKKIYGCIENIEFIIDSKELKITRSIEDIIIKPAIRSV